MFALAATLVAAQEESEGGPQVSEVSEEDVEAGPNAQEVAGVRKLRLRRPRPKIIAIDNEEGIAEGKPVPLKAGKECCQRKIVKLLLSVIKTFARKLFNVIVLLTSRSTSRSAY